MTRMIHISQHGADARFQADEAAGSQVEFLVLFFPFMRCVVGDDGINGAILQAGDAGCAVFFRADRRVDFIPCFKSAQGFIGQDEVLRRDFCRDLDAALLGLADQFDSVLGADVSDVDRCVSLRPGKYRGRRQCLRRQPDGL